MLGENVVVNHWFDPVGIHAADKIRPTVDAPKEDTRTGMEMVLPGLAENRVPVVDKEKSEVEEVVVVLPKVQVSE